MIAYLLTSWIGALVLLGFVALLSRAKRIPNRARLALLYLCLAKAILPWSPFSFALALPGPLWSGAKPQADLFATGQYAAESGPRLFASVDATLALVWALVSIALIVLSLFRLAAIHNAVRHSTPLCDGDLRSVAGSPSPTALRGRLARLVSAPCVSSPFVWWDGGWYIVVPASFASLDGRDRRAILAHELAHIGRNDFAKYLLLGLLKRVFFFNPAVWMIVADILACEEMETDREAISLLGIAPEVYGTTILNFYALSSSGGHTVPAFTGSAKRRLTMRIEELRAGRRRSMRFAPLWVAVFAFAFALPHANYGATKGSAALPLVNPVDVGRISLDYGPTKHPITHESYDHRGVDLAAPNGTPILSAMDGTVTAVEKGEKEGIYLVIADGSGLETLYSHLGKTNVAKGATVRAGERIAFVGSSGVSTGPHLHFEIHKDGVTINPHDVVNF
jgi:beta-lactamase regulating signal transducer with metallopeptidase domain